MPSAGSLAHYTAGILAEIALFRFFAFDITQQDVRTPKPNPNYGIQTGEIRPIAGFYALF